MAIEQVEPEFERIVSPDQDVEELGRGFGVAERPPFGVGYGSVCEGPVWWKEGGYLLFSDIYNSRRMKWASTEGVTTFQENTNHANGLTRDLQGRLIACEHGTRRVTRLEPDGSTTVVANRYHGRRLNRPNDVVVSSDGGIYFTDPYMPHLADGGSELDFSGVYRVSPDLGTINCIVRHLVRPNGLAFSPDETILYINEHISEPPGGHIKAFDVQPDGLLDLAAERVFCKLQGERPGHLDGMKVDMEGNVYSTGPGGIWVMDPSGRHLGTILTEQPPINMGWGGDDWKTLFFTTRRELGCIRLKIPGVPVPRKQ